jgi:hypothetical protein
MKYYYNPTHHPPKKYTKSKKNHPKTLNFEYIFDISVVGCWLRSFSSLLNWKEEII